MPAGREIALGFASCYFLPAGITCTINPKYHRKPCYYIYIPNALWPNGTSWLCQPCQEEV